MTPTPTSAREHLRPYTPAAANRASPDRKPPGTQPRRQHSAQRGNARPWSASPGQPGPPRISVQHPRTHPLASPLWLPAAPRACPPRWAGDWPSADWASCRQARIGRATPGARPSYQRASAASERWDAASPVAWSSGPSRASAPRTRAPPVVRRPPGAAARLPARRQRSGHGIGEGVSWPAARHSRARPRGIRTRGARVACRQHLASAHPCRTRTAQSLAAQAAHQAAPSRTKQHPR